MEGLISFIKKGEKYCIFLLLRGYSRKNQLEMQIKIKYIFMILFDAIKTEDVLLSVRY
jgi:hypothetical protein